MKLPATLILDDVSRTNPYRQMEIDNNLRISSIRCFDVRQGKRNFLCACACDTVDQIVDTSTGIKRGKKKKKKKRNEGTRLPRRKLTKQVDIKGTRAMQIDQRSHVTVRHLFFFFFFKLCRFFDSFV